MGCANGQDADPVYAYTSGGDYYPDLFISRFSSRSGAATNIDKQASRSIEYEKSPQTGANWYHVGLGVASNQVHPTINVVTGCGIRYYSIIILRSIAVMMPGARLRSSKAKSKLVQVS